MCLLLQAAKCILIISAFLVPLKGHNPSTELSLESENSLNILTYLKCSQRRGFVNPWVPYIISELVLGGVILEMFLCWDKLMLGKK